MSVNDNITKLNVPWYGEVMPDKVLSSAIGKLKRVLIIGEEDDGTPYYASSNPNIAETMFDLDKFKYKVLNGDYGHG